MEFTLESQVRSSRYAEYREREGDEYRTRDARRKRDARAGSVPRFIGVDSEGIGRGKNHRVVLLGVGSAQYVAEDHRKGLQYDEVFSFLYAQFQSDPKAVYVGFYLGYDFNQWLKSLPLKAAFMLLSPKGKALRVMRQPQGGMTHFPVREGEWEFDMLGFKRLMIRPRRPKGESLPWMYICDAGSFFQTSFVNVLNPDNWRNDPDGPLCDGATYARIIEWKNKRSTFTRITKGMQAYNIEENRLLAVCMDRLARGFLSVGIRLRNSQWYGPGATSKVWLKDKGTPKHRDLATLGMPEWFDEICRKSYFGGWFEIFSHGPIGGRKSRFFNYDINNAYPYAATKLPHLCSAGRYRRGHGRYQGSSPHVLLYCTVHAKSDRIGPVPFRDGHGNILRPGAVRGWYWEFELGAARRAGLIEDIETHEWAEFEPCPHDCPFEDLRVLYDLRLSVGKNSAQGMAIKLNNNSVYGNFAQQVGAAPYNNWFYASYITAHCRSQILDAIGSHPGGLDSVLMVATDGVCFDQPHPGLPVSKKLGEWEMSEYRDLVLFKPGVYWHHDGTEALLKVKSRGVPKEEFLKCTEIAEGKFTRFQDALRSRVPERLDDYLEENGWPWFKVKVGFRMRSCKQALNEGKWAGAGEVMEDVNLVQNSDPMIKRGGYWWNHRKARIDSRIHQMGDQLETRYHGEVTMPDPVDYGYNQEGPARNGLLEAHAVARGKVAAYDIGIGELGEYETEDCPGAPV